MKPDDSKDSKDLRRTFGQFATGVTVVTTSGLNGEPIGVTANSFSSVSLEPPMVLWSLATDAFSRAAFEAAERFCVHILTAAQRSVSETFACQGGNKFGSVSWSRGAGDVPLLDEFVARFHCRTANQYPVGDHIVFVGEVLGYDKTDERPLVFHGGQYALAERRMMEEVALRVGQRQPFPGDRRKRRG